VKDKINWDQFLKHLKEKRQEIDNVIELIEEAGVSLPKSSEEREQEYSEMSVQESIIHYLLNSDTSVTAQEIVKGLRNGGLKTDHYFSQSTVKNVLKTMEKEDHTPNRRGYSKS